MNRLILIGNGFDLAHGIKTSYKDFILSYLKMAFNTAKNSYKYDDELLTVTLNMEYIKRLNHDNIDIWELHDFYKYIQPNNESDSHYNYDIYLNNNEYIFEIKSELILKLLICCEEYNWVDIENEYYKTLCTLASKNKESEIFKLNSDFQILQNLLQNYLGKIETEYFLNMPDVSNSLLVSKLTELIEHNAAPKPLLEYLVSNVTTRNKNKTAEKIEAKGILFLNFNYTSTIENYSEKIKEIVPNTSIIYIHGKLRDSNNPIIFGYGDEEETNFKALEKYDECLKYVKTYWYLRTHNYERLLTFIDSDQFEVYIMGHSCGMSDKTMLSSIFNNPNCKKIKILTYDKTEGRKNLDISTTNYIEMTYQIGRLFNEKSELRKKLIPFDSRDVLNVKLKNHEIPGIK
ncbi:MULTISPECIES: AbiH family protein [Elizabethkingia]|uniref:AbiH family protein n=1 Tax=Elizabethkingia TaxID=308865 RepID=UPI00038A2642|nr:AbiH family protein [Elizabethkingia anophelis]EQB90979.1 hypothetical protein C874_14815 [Elizabethkingia anophelis 502]MCT3760825.1 hypothetical protein [Elizabethkingia anophelis]